ncbi:TolC family protein [Deinococcus koreensis]|uniref:TolC family protein n=1 Tax=Deinococcus koreensis TaxID=2054903 RepID=A0A2K3UT26_9DEIO|nr:TolC family protein [Deinococcus koreensis]PNY79693.1 TolC family protein [Deinococcus koreensis]
MNPPPLLSPARRRPAPLGLGLALSAGLGGPALAQATPAAPAVTSAVTGPALTLDAALARLAGSPSVTQAQLSVKVAQSNLNAARTALGLTVSVSGNAGYSGPSSLTAADGTVSAVDSSLSGSAGVNVSLGLLPWSSNQSSLRSSQRSLELAQANLQEATGSARLNVYQQYYAAVLATLDIDLAGRTLALRQRQLGVARIQQQGGNATAGSVLSAQADVQAAQGSELQAAGSLDAARRSLSAALGADLGDVSFPSQPPDTLTVPDVAALVARARASRQEVVQARGSLGAAQDALETQQRDATLPEITASLRYGPASSGGLSASLSLKQGTLGAGYSLPLGASTTGATSSSADRLTASLSGSYVISSPAVRAQVSAAQASVTQAQLSLSVAQQSAERDVRSRFGAAQTSLIAVQTRATAVQVAGLALDTARIRLQAGTATADDVTGAELALAQAERELLQARVTAHLNLIQLDHAAGGPA